MNCTTVKHFTLLFHNNIPSTSWSVCPSTYITINTHAVGFRQDLVHQAWHNIIVEELEGNCIMALQIECLSNGQNNFSVKFQFGYHFHIIDQNRIIKTKLHYLRFQYNLRKQATPSSKYRNISNIINNNSFLFHK